MTKKYLLEWRPVITWYAKSELAHYDYIWSKVADTRHDLFVKIKFSDRELLGGGWGPESLYWDPNLETGFVWCTQARQKEIEAWITTTAQQVAPGND